MTPRLDAVTLVALAVLAALPSGACAALSRGPVADPECDRALDEVLVSCALEIREADESHKPALRAECKAQIDALPECK